MPELTLLPFADRLLAMTIAAWISLLLVLPPGVQHFLLLDATDRGLLTLFTMLERKLNRPLRPASVKRLRGWIVALLVLIFGILIGGWISALTLQGGWFVIPEILILVMVFSFWRPGFYAAEASKHLQSKKEAERKKASPLVQKMVFFDVDGVDAHGLYRLLIEAMALHLTCRVVAVAFWYLLLGLPGMIVSSLFLLLARRWHYPEKRYDSFGKPFRTIGKIIMFLPERIACLCIVLAACIAPRNHPAEAAKALASPQAYPWQGGMVLTTVAGALRVALGGPRTIEGEKVKLPWLDFGPARIESLSVRQMQWLYGLSVGIIVVIITALNLLTTRGAVT